MELKIKRPAKKGKVVSIPSTPKGTTATVTFYISGDVVLTSPPSKSKSKSVESILIKWKASDKPDLSVKSLQLQSLHRVRSLAWMKRCTIVYRSLGSSSSGLIMLPVLPFL